MQFEDFKNKIHAAFTQNGMAGIITEETLSKFYDFSEYLLETNKTTNLTAITDIDGVILKHIVDSVAISSAIPHSANVIDVGCGPGFPSIPLAIVRDDLSITALDSTGKKIDFVNSAIAKLQLSNIKGVCSRAEEFVVDYREKFDVSVSRAVARLNVLAEISLPLIKVGGTFIAMKSNKGEEEYAEAEKGIETLGASLSKIDKQTFTNNSEAIERETYIFTKKRKTPSQYPRKYSQILKKPL